MAVLALAILNMTSMTSKNMHEMFWISNTAIVFSLRIGFAYLITVCCESYVTSYYIVLVAVNLDANYDSNQKD